MSLIYDSIKNNIDALNKVKNIYESSESISFIATETGSFDLLCFSEGSIFKTGSTTENYLTFISPVGQKLPSDPSTLLNSIDLDFYSLAIKLKLNLIEGKNSVIECKNQKSFLYKLSDFYSMSPIVMPADGVTYTFKLNISPNYISYSGTPNIFNYVPRRLSIKIDSDVIFYSYEGVGDYYKWKFEVLDADTTLEGLNVELKNSPFFQLELGKKFNISFSPDQFKTI